MIRRGGGEQPLHSILIEMSTILIFYFPQQIDWVQSPHMLLDL